MNIPASVGGRNVDDHLFSFFEFELTKRKEPVFGRRLGHINSEFFFTLTRCNLHRDFRTAILVRLIGNPNVVASTFFRFCFKPNTRI